MLTTTPLAPAILDTIIARLALLFLSGAAGDMTAARHAAAKMLAGYHAETEDELRLAAAIISFGFQALEALSQAATPDMPLTRAIRLRGSAVSLSRETHKAERRLDQLQNARRAGAPAQPATTAPSPRIEKAIELIADTRALLDDATNNGGQSWTQAWQQRQRAKRMTDNLKKNQSAHLAAPAAAAGNPAQTNCATTI